MKPQTWWWAGWLSLPFFALAQNHPCLDLLDQSAQAGVTAHICGKNVNMDALAQTHNQNQCAEFFGTPEMKQQLPTLAAQSSQRTAKTAQQMGEAAFCQQQTQQLQRFLK